MSRRIEIEITSIGSESATWRAAGAKLPKGALPLSLLPSGSKTGDVFRADADQTMEGVEIVALLPQKTASPRKETIALIPQKKQSEEVTVTYAPKGGRGRRDGDGERRGGAPRGDRKPRERSGERSGGGESRGPRDARGGRRERPARPVGPPVLTTHRNAFLATLTPEQLPVAEQLLRGGLPAVRTAVADQNKTAAAQGRPTVNAEAIDRIANDLLGKANLASWKDRAGGAQSAGKELRLRDLRAVVTSAKTVNLDDEARAMLTDLKTQLTTKVEHLTNEWNTKIAAALEGKDALLAVTLASRPPEFRLQVASTTAAAIATLVSETLTDSLDAAAWVALVQAAAASPMHRSIKPTGIPADDSVRAEAIKVAGNIPEIAKMLGMKVPPPPPARPATARRSGSAPRS